MSRTFTTDPESQVLTTMIGTVAFRKPLGSRWSGYYQEFARHVSLNGGPPLCGATTDGKKGQSAVHDDLASDVKCAKCRSELRRFIKDVR